MAQERFCHKCGEDISDSYDNMLPYLTGWYCNVCDLLVPEEKDPFEEDYRPRVHNRHAGTAPHDAIYVGRGSPWGNPFRIGKHGNRQQVIERFRREVLSTLDLTRLRGRHLVCFCSPLPCHADILLEHANK